VAPPPPLAPAEAPRGASQAQPTDPRVEAENAEHEAADALIRTHYEALVKKREEERKRDPDLRPLATLDKIVMAKYGRTLAEMTLGTKKEMIAEMSKQARTPASASA